MRTLALKLWPLAAIGCALALAIGLFAARADSTGAAAMSIDLDTAGNTATALGTRDECREVNAGDSVTIDVTIEDIPASNAMVGFGFELGYSTPEIAIIAADAGQLLGAAPGSSPFSAGDETVLPDADGAFLAGATDIGIPLETTAESGSGVLERLTLDISAAATPGKYTLALANAAHIDASGEGRPPAVLHGAYLAISVTCDSLATPLPAGAKGDVDCTGAIDAVDSLKLLRTVAGLGVTQTEPCDDIGTGSPMQGDINCDSNITALDALFILRYVAQLNVNLPGGCAAIGS